MKVRLLYTALIIWVALIGLRAFGLATGSIITEALGIHEHAEWWALLLVSPVVLLISTIIAWLLQHNRRLKNRLRLEQEFTRTLLDRLPSPVYYKGADGRYLGGNRALEELLGAPMETIIGARLEDFCSDPNQVRIYAGFDRALLENEVETEQREIELSVAKDGRPVHRTLVNYRARFQNPVDESYGIIGVLFDVSELRKVERLRETIGRRLHKLTEHIPGALFQFQLRPDGSSTFPFVTVGFRDLYGVGPATVAEDASAIFAMIHPEDRTPLDESIRRSAESLEVWQSQHRILRDGGEVRWISGQAKPEQLEDGSILWHGYLSDITDLKAAESIAHQNAELLRAMFENLPDHVYYKDRQCRFLGGNRAWWAQRTHDLADIIGKTDADFYPPELAQELLAGELRVMETGIAARRREKHLREDGTPYYFESLKCPFFGPDGQVEGIVGISRDVTEQVEMEQNLIRAKEAAEEASVAKSEFLAMMSHEIRTPMNGVIGATSILLNTPLTEEQQEFVRTIQVSGDNLLVIINDILDYSKIEADRIELEANPFDLRSCVEDAIDLFTATAAEKGIELAFSVDPAVPDRFVGDITRVRQVLVNLLSNGMKFTEKGEVVLRVKLTAFNKHDRQCEVSFTVRDTGVGVPEARRHRLFQPFSQADASNTRRFGGTGLGLVISRKLVELMGGKIDFDSTEGVGSSFHFTLPLPLAPDARICRTKPVATSLSGKHIVAVDDNQTNRKILAETLNYWGIRTSSFASAQDLLTALPELEPVDAAILDFQMPDMDGVTLAERLRAHPAFADTPIILLSSVDNSPNSPAIQLRLSKPAKMQSLQRNLERLLNPQGRFQATKAITPEEIASRSSIRILVAEDNAINQRIAQMMLNRLGYNPMIVADGEEAVVACSQHDFDIVLMDIQMPRVDGLKATERIREITQSTERPYILALTAGAMQSDREAAAEVGMNGFLAKPLKIEQLRDTLDAIIRRGEPAVE